MNLFQEKYNRANALGDKFHLAERKGYLKPGSRAKANETILVPRQEVVQLARDYGSAVFSSFFGMYEELEFVKFIGHLAEGHDDTVTCDKCRMTYRTSWGVGCPRCMVRKTVEDRINRELREKEGDAL